MYDHLEGDLNIPNFSITLTLTFFKETPKEIYTTTRRNNLDSSGSTPGSVAEEYSSPSIDKDLIRMDNAMDDWCLQLKRNVLVRS